MHKWVQHKGGHLKAIDELSSRVKLFFEVKIEQRLKIETPWLFFLSQTFILVEQIRKIIHRSEDFPLIDVVQRLRSFFSQHEPDLSMKSVCLFPPEPLEVHCFAVMLFSRTRVTHHC